ncbi:MAG: DMT family transporter [Desulfobacterales bacterium]|nr:DMT family transporter [Desulfobacterales bacterium]
MAKLSVPPVVGVFAGALIISFSSVFVNISGVDPMVSAFYRVFFGWIFLALACGLKGEFRRQPLNRVFMAMVCGVVFSIDLYCWHTSIDFIGPGLATILGNCQVFILAVAGWLIYRERLTGLFLLALPMALVGLYMVIGLDGAAITPEYLKGIGYGVLTALSYGAFILLIRSVQSDGSGTLFFYQVVVTASASMCLGCFIVFGDYSFLIPNARSLAALVGVGVFCQALAWVVISYCLPDVPASRAGLILLLQPALSFVWDVLLFDRQTGIMGWLGVVVVLVAIYMGMGHKSAEDTTTPAGTTG